MIELPSGRFIDLSTSRARYHALQKKSLGPESSHRQLYSLIDIVYRKSDKHGMVKRGWSEYDYDYSGYTLNSVRQADDWSDKDKTALFQWVQQNDQHRLIETARRRLNDNQQQLSVRRYSPPQHLYSLLRHRLQALPLKSASAQQWLATINRQKQKGVREEEIQWSGLRSYLLRQTPETIISKKQLLQNWHDKHLRLELSTEQIWGESGGLNFEEVVLRMPHQVVYRAALKLDHDCLCLLRYVDSYCNYRVGVVKTLSNNHPMALNKFWFALDPYGRAIENTNSDNNSLFFDTSFEAKAASNLHAKEHLGVHSGASPHTQFDHITLFAGNDYREWFVSLPDYQRSFFGAHFYAHNILAHIRTTTRIDDAGRKILFIEEVQSDWHQNGKRYGYDNSSWGRIANAPFKQEWSVLAMKLMLIQASQNGFSGIAWSMGSVQEMRYKSHLQSIKKYYDQTIPRALNRLVKNFNTKVESTLINTRDPWLNLEKEQEKWCVSDVAGKFKTRARYNNRDEAMAVISRHCRTVELQVPVLFINEELMQQISEKGLPMYGHTID